MNPVERSLDVEWLTSLLLPGGAFSRDLASYEHRPSQVSMMQAVAHRFNSGGNLIVEAGTGTGKSVAYLIPAIYYSLINSKPVVISTNTINLQEQLLCKDIPDLTRALKVPSEFRAVALKGRSHYLCLRKWYAQRHLLPGLEGGLELIPRIAAWLGVTETGDHSELMLHGHQTQLWNALCAEGRGCVGNQCSHHREGECFVTQARVRSKNANIIVVNHALLLTDARAENQLLPCYDTLIVDEAHHLEDAATEQFGFAVSSSDIDDLFRATYHALDEVDRVMRVSRLAPRRKQDVAGAVDCARAACNEAGHNAARLFPLLGGMVEAESRGETGATYEKSLRFTGEITDGQSWVELSTATQNLELTMSHVESRLANVHGALDSGFPGSNEDIEASKSRLETVIADSAELRDRVAGSLTCPDGDMVYWASIKNGPARSGGRSRPAKVQRGGMAMDVSRAATAGVSVHAAPLDVAPLLSRLLFSSKEAVILTSATLSAAGSFKYIKGRLGVTADEEMVLDSPFDYRAAALILAPDDIPAPDRPGYAEAVQGVISNIALVSRGRMLVLFTSHQAIRNTWSAIKGPLAAQGLSVLAQGIDGSPEQLLAAFRSDSRAVLLGAASLWEGIDIVGDALSVLVIARLPFGVPVDPVFAARSSLFDDPFAEYSLPQAVLRFKQGFGRLVRSKTDRGVALVLDKRIHSRSYGRVFLDSLPMCNIRVDPLKNLPQTVSDWLARP